MTQWKFIGWLNLATITLGTLIPLSINSFTRWNLCPECFHLFLFLPLPSITEKLALSLTWLFTLWSRVYFLPHFPFTSKSPVAHSHCLLPPLPPTVFALAFHLLNSTISPLLKPISAYHLLSVFALGSTNCQVIFPHSEDSDLKNS